MKRRKRETKRERKAREADRVIVVQHGQSNAAGERWIPAPKVSE